MRLSFASLFLVLLSFAVCGKFNLTKEFLTSRKWAYESPDSMKILVLRDDMTVFEADNTTRIQGTSWDYNYKKRMVRIVEVGEDVKLGELSTVLTVHTSDNTPIVKIMGFQLKQTNATTSTMFKSLTEVKGNAPLPQVIDKETLLANAWKLNAGTADGLH